MLKRALVYDWSGALAVLGVILITTAIAMYIGGFGWWSINAVGDPGVALVALAALAKWRSWQKGG